LLEPIAVCVEGGFKLNEKQDLKLVAFPIETECSHFEYRHFQAHAWSTGLPCPTLPTPIQAKPLSLPRNYCFRLDDHQRWAPLRRPYPRK